MVTLVLFPGYMDKRLAAWLETARGKGYTKEQIKTALQKEGYPEQALQDAMKNFDAVQSPQNAISSKKTIIAAAIVLILIVSIGFYILHKPGTAASSGPHVKEVTSSVPGLALVETVVQGQLEIVQPELNQGKWVASNRSIMRPFKISVTANGLFLDNYTVLLPLSALPDEAIVKQKALESLGLLQNAPEEYRNSYTKINGLSKDTFVIWKGGELMISKGNLLKTQFMGAAGLALLSVSNSRKESAVLADYDSAGSYQIYFRNNTVEYEMHDYTFTAALSEQQAGGTTATQSVPNGAVAVQSGKVAGIFYTSEQGSYFMPASILHSFTER